MSTEMASEGGRSNSMILGRRNMVLDGAFAALTAACSKAQSTVQASSEMQSVVPPVSRPLPFDQAVLTAANIVFSSAAAVDRDGGRKTVRRNRSSH